MAIFLLLWRCHNIRNRFTLVIKYILFCALITVSHKCVSKVFTLLWLHTLKYTKVTFLNINQPSLPLQVQVQSLIKSPSATLLSCRSHTLSIMEDIEFFSLNDYTTLCSCMVDNKFKRNGSSTNWKYLFWKLFHFIIINTIEFFYYLSLLSLSLLWWCRQSVPLICIKIFKRAYSKKTSTIGILSIMAIFFIKLLARSNKIH